MMGRPYDLIIYLRPTMLRRHLDRSERATHDLRDLPDLLHHRSEGFGLERLPAIRNRLRGIGMNFDDESIRTGGDACAGNGSDKF